VNGAQGARGVLRVSKWATPTLVTPSMLPFFSPRPSIHYSIACGR